MIVWDEFRFGWYIAWEKPSIVRFQKASWPCRHHHGHHVGRARATLYSMGRSVSVQLRPWIGLTLVAKRGNVSTMWREYRVLDVTDVHLICLTEMLLIQIVTKITAWELLLRSLDDSGLRLRGRQIFNWSTIWLDAKFCDVGCILNYYVQQLRRAG